MALTDLATLKSFLNIPNSNTSSDIWLDSLREAAEASVKAYCKRDFESQSYTEYHNGNNTRHIVLRQRPVTEISSIYLDTSAYYGTNPDGAFGSDTLLTSGIDYALKFDQSTTSSCGVVIRINGVWPSNQREHWLHKISPQVGPAYGNIKVTYTAGYSTIPMDLQYAVCYLVSFMKRNINIGGQLGSERIGDYSYELLSPRFIGNAPPELTTSRQILARYREISWP